MFIILSHLSCIYQCKDTNFKANHNPTARALNALMGCIYQCKDTNFKANHNPQRTW